MCVVQLVAYGERVKRECKYFTECLDASRRTFLGEFAGFVVVSEVRITGLHCDDGRLDDGWWRDEGRLARVDAGISLALCDEVSGAFVGDDLKVVGSTGVCEVDGRRRPLAEDDDPLFLSHGDVLGVVIPVIAEGVELSLKFVGDGRDERIIGILEGVFGTTECEGFVAEEAVDFTPDLGSD